MSKRRTVALMTCLHNLYWPNSCVSLAGAQNVNEYFVALGLLRKCKAGECSALQGFSCVVFTKDLCVCLCVCVSRCVSV